MVQRNGVSAFCPMSRVELLGIIDNQKLALALAEIRFCFSFRFQIPSV